MTDSTLGELALIGGAHSPLLETSTLQVLIGDGDGAVAELSQGSAPSGHCRQNIHVKNLWLFPSVADENLIE